jgi:hypothetical protein
VLERLLLAASLWAVVLFAMYQCRRFSPLHMFVCALGMTGLVGSFFPVLSLWIEPSSWRNISHLGSQVILETQKDYLCFALGLAAAWWIGSNLGWLSTKPVRPPSPAASARARQRDFLIAGGLVLAGLPLYFLFVKSVGLRALLNREDYAQKYLLSTGLGPLASGLSMVMAGCLWAEASQLSPRARWLFRSLAALVCVWSIAGISVRSNFVLLLVGYLYLLCARRRIELHRVRITLVLGLVCAYVGLEAFTLFRGQYRGDAFEAVRLLGEQGEAILAPAVGGSELSHPFITCAEVERGQEAGELAGESLVDGVLALMPVKLLPDRPKTLSERFVWKYYTPFAAAGGGTAFSLVAEGWLDFGARVGPFLVGLALGCALLLVERRRAAYPLGAVARLAPYLVFMVAICHRNEFAGLLKQTFTISVPVVALWILAHAVRSSTSRMRPRRPPEIPRMPSRAFRSPA